MTTSAAKTNRRADRVDRLEAENERLRSTIRAFGRGDIVPITDKDAEIERLLARLDMIADIAEGSTTANSLPHIAKIARGVEQLEPAPAAAHQQTERKTGEE